MNRRAWQDTVHGGLKESDMIKWLSLFFNEREQKPKRVADSEQWVFGDMISRPEILDSVALPVVPGSTTGHIFVLRRDCCYWREVSSLEYVNTWGQILILLFIVFWSYFIFMPLDIPYFNLVCLFKNVLTFFFFSFFFYYYFFFL